MTPDFTTPLPPEEEALVDEMRSMFAYYWHRPPHDRTKANTDARRLLTDYLARRDALTLERAAKWHDEMAEGLRVRAETTLREWTNSRTIPNAEDRRANYADARNDGEKATWHESCAAAIRDGAKGA